MSLIAVQLFWIASEPLFCVDYFTSKPACQCFGLRQGELHNVDTQEAKYYGSLRNQLFGHGQATESGEWAPAWLLQPPLVTSPITESYRQQNTPLKKGNDEYQMWDCGSLWMQVENLQCWKPALVFARGACWRCEVIRSGFQPWEGSNILAKI